MDVRELLKQLAAHGFRPELDYVVNEPHQHEGTFRLSETNARWYVTFMERGIERPIAEFEHEDEACRGFLGVMLRHR